MSKKTESLFYKLRLRRNIESAWSHIYSNGKNSSSETTRSAIKEFEIKRSTNIERIHRQLRNSAYEFTPAKGVLAGDKNRPLVIANVQDRVIQRAILNVLQEDKRFEKYLSVKTSFGAIKSIDRSKKKGVPTAIEYLINSIKNGATHFYKSDIASFFTNIPLNTVLEVFKKEINEKDFCRILERATKIEVGNMSELGGYKQYFDFNEVGTPQGCCLSPLIGNILLYDFDQEMNEGDITCLRYLDDFIILGPDEKAIEAAFRRAQRKLAVYGLHAYTPSDEPSKAQKGSVFSKFDYLGVEIDGKNRLIRPSKKSISNLKSGVNDLISVSMNVDFSKIDGGAMENFSLNATLRRISNKVKGWGNQYFYCNDPSLWGSIDSEISDLLDQYVAEFMRVNIRRLDESKKSSSSWLHERRMKGIYLLHDCKTKEIAW